METEDKLDLIGLSIIKNVAFVGPSHDNLNRSLSLSSLL